MKKSVVVFLLVIFSSLTSPLIQSEILPDQLAAPKVIAKSQNGHPGMTRRDFIKTTAITGAVGTVVASLPRPVQGMILNRLTPTDLQLKEKAIDADLLITQLQAVVFNYYQKVDELAQALRDTNKLQKKITTLNQALLRELSKGVNEILKQSGRKITFNFPENFVFLNQFFNTKGYWFEAKPSKQIVGGRVLENVWSFALAEIGEHRKEMELDLIQTMGEEPRLDRIHLEEMILGKVLIFPFKQFVYSKYGKYAYTSSWLWASPNWDRAIIIHDKPSLIESGRKLWRDLRTKEPLDLTQLQSELKPFIEAQNYAFIGARVSHALRQRQWGRADQFSDEDPFAKEYADWMMDLFQWGISVEVQVDELTSPEEGRFNAIKRLLIRQFLSQLAEGLIPHEILAGVIDWIWTEPQESLLYKAMDRLLILGILSPIYQNHQNLHESLKEDYQKTLAILIAYLPKFDEEQIAKIAQEALQGEFRLERKEPVSPPKGHVPSQSSSEGWIASVGVLQAL